MKTDVAPMDCPGFPEPAWALETGVPKAGRGAKGLVRHLWATRERHCLCSHPLEAVHPEWDPRLCWTPGCEAEAGLRSPLTSQGPLGRIPPGAEAEAGGVQAVPPMGSDLENSWETRPQPLLPPAPTI